MLRLAVSATFTANPLERIFSFWAAQLGWPVETVFAPYGRLHESLIDPQSVLAQNRRGVNFVLLRWEDLGPDEAARQANAGAIFDDLARARFFVPTVLSIAPSRQETPLVAGARERFAETVLPAEVASLYPVESVFSEQGERLGHVPFSEAYFAAWGTLLFRRAHRLLAPPVKVIVTDADDTLWAGVCGEDGPEGICLPPGRRALQEFLKQQRDGGRLLALASKNNWEDVRAAFAAHPEFPLRLESFAVCRVGWNEKSQSLEEMARELNLGLNSFAVLDDSAKECAAIAAAHPEVAVLPVPHEDAELEPFLRHLWLFDQGPVTAEDRKRAESYQSVAAFEQARGAARSLAEFYQSLQLEVEFRPVEPAEILRAAQLTQRTNQFNCTTIRRSEAELKALLAEGYTIWVARVRDRFGDYGLTGLVIGRPEGPEWVVETFLLSCRVLGRGVEHEIVRRLAAIAQAAGCERVRICFEPTAVNEPARQFLASLPAAGDRDRVAPWTEWLDLPFPGPQELAAMPPAAAPSNAPAAQPLFRDYARLARHLRTVDQILEALRGHWTPPADAATWTETERRLAAIWAELLRTPDLQPSSNFFDLGGHSLLAVLLLTRIQETFGVDLSIDAVYDAGVTLASLAARIDAAKHSDLSEEEYAALVAEIQSLSDEEVQALLNQPGGTL